MNNKKKEVVGKKYFLIVFGVYMENQTLLTGLLNQFEPILSSNFLKFHFGKDYVIAHFETEETQKDVRDFCDLVLSTTVENFINQAPQGVSDLRQVQINDVPDFSDMMKVMKNKGIV